MSEHGRGRGRGRAHRQQQDEPPSTSRAQAPPSAWGRRPGPMQGPGAPPYARPGPSQGAGPRMAGQGDQAAIPGPSRQVERMDIAPPVGVGVGGGRGYREGAGGEGGGGDVVSAGRGAMRGRRIIAAETLKTKPENLATKKGTTGQKIMLQANYFKMLATTDWCLYLYSVDFAPEEDRTVVRKGLVKLHRERLGGYIFDGSLLYTSHRLPDNLQLFSARQGDGATIQITIKLVGDMTKGDQHYIQFFNIIMRKCFEHLKLQLVGRDYYDAKNKASIPQFRLELWPGYLTSIRQHENNILMGVEISHKVMRQETLLHILERCATESRSDYKNKFMFEVVGLTVLTDYNNRTYRIDDVHFDVTPRSTFQLKSGESISFIDYFRKKYGLKITSNTQPLLVSRTKARERRAGQSETVYLVPELCRPTGLTDAMRNNFQLMRELANHTRVSPAARIQKLIGFNKRLQDESNIRQEFRDWNLQLDERLVDIEGRVLPNEEIFFGNTGKQRSISAGPEADWTRSLRDVHMLRCPQLTNWVLIATHRAANQVDSFVNSLQKAAAGLRFSIQKPIVERIENDLSATYTSALERVMSQRVPQLIFCIVSNNREERYIAIKKKCCVDRPVPTQVFVERNLNAKGLMSIATKVAIQINCKLGGAPWALGIPSQTMMVVGFDVCHNTSKKGQDFGALVASLDPTFTSYFSAVSAHETGDELSTTLPLQIEKALHKYRTRNKALPERIIIYRDGVGDGQIPHVFEFEVRNIQQRLAQIYGNPDLVKMTFIIVTKRINTRLFVNRNNPPPGTVVDDVITNPLKYDFFIVSQYVRQGTVSPTAYSIIADSSGWRPDHFQRLTYKLTHLYYNWSGTVRVPAPCQYAHKLAFLVGKYIHQMPSPALEHLYFL